MARAGHRDPDVKSPTEILTQADFSTVRANNESNAGDQSSMDRFV